MPRFLSEEENGIIKLLVSYSLLFAQFASLGFQAAFVVATCIVASLRLLHCDDDYCCDDDH